MIAVETNILVYAHRRDSKWHQQAKGAVESLANGNGLWAIPWPCVHEFISIVTHTKIYNPPSTLAEAFSQIEAWQESSRLVFLAEADSHLPLLADFSMVAKIAGPRIQDARIAAICVAHGVREVWTADRDFQAFPGLKTRNPVVKA